MRFDYFHAVRLALHHAKHGFGSGLAALWDEGTDRRAHRIARGAFVTHHPAGPAVGHKLFLNAKTIKESSTRTLFHRHQVKCLLIERGVEVPDWIHRIIPSENIVLFMDPSPTPCFGWKASYPPGSAKQQYPSKGIAFG